MASDKNHRPCLPLKPQEKSLVNYFIKDIFYEFFKTSHIGQMPGGRVFCKIVGDKSVRADCKNNIFFG